MANWYTRSWEKSPVTTLIGTVLAGGAAWFIGKKIFRPMSPPLLPVFDLPQGGAGIPQVGTTIDPKTGKPTIRLWSPIPLANELYTTMEGLDPTINKEEAWRKLAELPNQDQVVAVYNSFNKIPAVQEDASDYGTLTTWIRDEYGSFTGSWKPRALQRLELAGLP